jgi:hypothetical protein
LADPLVNSTGTQVADLQGHEAPRSTFASLLSTYDRIWLIDNRLPMLPGPDPAAKVKVKLLTEPAFVRLGRWPYKGGKVTLYERRRPEMVLARAPLSPKKKP